MEIDTLVIAFACLGTLVLGLMVYFVLRKREQRERRRSQCDNYDNNQGTTQSNNCNLEITNLPAPPPYNNCDVPPPYRESEIELGEAVDRESVLDFAPPPYIATQEAPPPYTESSDNSSSQQPVDGR